MKVTVLGCGSSAGVPAIGLGWGCCNPVNPKNRRMRPAILVEDAGHTILIDAGPDLRQQLVDRGLKRLDALFITHYHADHINGIDDLRPLNNLMKKPIETYLHRQSYAILKQRISYIFQKPKSDFFTHTVLNPHIVGARSFRINQHRYMPIVQDHGFGVVSLGFRFGDFAYNSDVHHLDQQALKRLRGIRTWIVDCLGLKPHPTHAHLAKVLDWANHLQVERVFLTHMNQDCDYEALNNASPDHVTPCWDGMVVDLS